VPAAPPILRLLVVLPSWVGDAVMATPTLRLVRAAHPGTFIGGLVRPGIDQLLAGTDLLDEVHVERAQGMMGPKLVANKVRPRRYDAALLLPNSLSSALIVRLAGIPRRLGYDRDARGLLLTSRVAPPKDIGGPRAGQPALVSAVDYYYNLVRRLDLVPAPVSELSHGAAAFLNLPPGQYMELGTTQEDEQLAAAILAEGRIPTGHPFAILNPGGNNPAKRWPADRFAAIGADLARGESGDSMAILVNGSPGEADLCDEIEKRIRDASPDARVLNLSHAGNTLGSLKALTRTAALMLTNDTGPRHIAAALGTPLVSLFGPTDHRWTTIPTRPGAPEVIVAADPTLPAHEIANDHPERCRIDRIGVEIVREGIGRVLEGSSQRRA
jgi:heptosyltransferase-2